MSPEDTPTRPQAPAFGSAPTTTPTPTSTPRMPETATIPKSQPRSGPIVAGALLLVLCAYAIVHALGGTIDATTWIIATVIGLGAILLIVGIAVLVRGSHNTP